MNTLERWCALHHDTSSSGPGLWEFLPCLGSEEKGTRGRRLTQPTSSSTRSACILQAQVCLQRSKGLLPNPHPTTGKSDLHKAKATAPGSPGRAGVYWEHSRRAGGPGLQPWQREGPPHRPQPSSCHGPGPRAGISASALLRCLFFTGTGSFRLAACQSEQWGHEPGHKGIRETFSATE